MPANLGPHHDRLANLEMLDFGGGVQVSLTQSLDVFGSFMTTTAGRNSHALARGITIGASWSFGARRLGSLSDAFDAEEPLAKCFARSEVIRTTPSCDFSQTAPNSHSSPKTPVQPSLSEPVSYPPNQ